jgi:uncharacterized protein YciI
MQFLIIGKDGTDSEALNRRLAARPAHIELGNELTAQGHMWYGAALLNDSGTMVGSMLLMDFPSEKELNEWLAREPYVTGDVWRSVEVQRCNVRDPWQFNRPKEFFEARALGQTKST